MRLSEGGPATGKGKGAHHTLSVKVRGRPLGQNCEFPPWYVIPSPRVGLRQSTGENDTGAGRALTSVRPSSKHRPLPLSTWYAGAGDAVAQAGGVVIVLEHTCIVGGHGKRTGGT